MHSEYLTLVGLPDIPNGEELLPKENLVAQAYADDRTEFTDMEILGLYQRLSVAGGIPAEGKVFTLDSKPYDLAETYGLSTDLAELRNHSMTQRLWKLNGVIEKLVHAMPMHWTGIYRCMERDGEPTLVQEASIPDLSRAEFPLTPQWTAVSNIAWAGAEQKAVLIQNLQRHAGRYYYYNTKVGAELALPIFTDGVLTGVMDLESYQNDFFTPERIMQVIDVVLELPKFDPFFAEKT